MSDVLARIRVVERHGIRRFLYPLQAELTLPTDIFPGQKHRLSLVDADRTPIPLQVTPASGRQDEPQRLDFAVSLAPHAKKELRLTLGAGPMLVDDPLAVVGSTAHKSVRSTQRRFALTMDHEGAIRDVVYDGVTHLRGPSAVLRNDAPMSATGYQDSHGGALLAAWAVVEGRYPDGRAARTRTELTACKSWAAVSHRLDRADAGDRFTFFLPFALGAGVATCDFGVGGGTFGKLEQGEAEEVVWRTAFAGDTARWSIATAGRTDYVGETPSKGFRAQRWFHLMDNEKALAVAITDVPVSCQEMTVSLTVTGDVAATFRLGDPEDAADFGICYHFLNGIPAIAAATNPQSILLPPTVEVLPA